MKEGDEESIGRGRQGKKAHGSVEGMQGRGKKEKEKTREGMKKGRTKKETKQEREGGRRGKEVVKGKARKERRRGKETGMTREGH